MHYTLRCTECGAEYPEESGPFRLTCDEDHGAALLRAEYSEKDFLVADEEKGMFRYRNWLPVRRSFPDASGTVVYHEKALGAAMGLDNLYTAFNGFRPEIGAGMETCSFKELEALSVCGRTGKNSDEYMVVSSAGNTGRSFLQICSKYNVRVCVIIPESAVPDMWTTVNRSETALLIAVSDADYYDVIRIGSVIAGLPGFYPEGGAKNVARRDGMGSVLLSAVDELGVVPDHYVQAVGSGTGGIAAWEMSVRLKETGRYGREPMKLHLVQNKPFAIMHDAWKAGLRDLFPFDEEESRKNIAKLWSPVLSNRKPPYGITGGVFDSLSASGGFTYAVSSGSARSAGRAFSDISGIDLDPAAEVAVAGLEEACRAGSIGKSDVVLLNVTGGGSRHPGLEGRKKQCRPDLVLTGKETDEEIANRLDMLTAVKIPR